jgi:hypothetical protein
MLLRWLVSRMFYFKTGGGLRSSQGIHSRPSTGSLVPDDECKDSVRHGLESGNEPKEFERHCPQFTRIYRTGTRGIEPQPGNHASPCSAGAQKAPTSLHQTRCETALPRVPASALSSLHRGGSSLPGGNWPAALWGLDLSS